MHHCYKDVYIQWRVANNEVKTPRKGWAINLGGLALYPNSVPQLPAANQLESDTTSPHLAEEQATAPELEELHVAPVMSELAHNKGQDDQLYITTWFA